MYPVGKLRYEEPEVLSFQAIIAIAVSGSILLVILVIVCVLYRVKSRRSDDMMKKMRIQMDMLEARVANECKEGLLHALNIYVCACVCVCVCVCVFIPTSSAALLPPHQSLVGVGMGVRMFLCDDGSKWCSPVCYLWKH